MEHILTSIKKLLGITDEYEHFDADIIMHINSAFSDLHQLGVGPTDGFLIQDSDALWSEFISEDDKRFESVKDYVYLSVKLVFDPPPQSSVLAAMERRIEKLEWRLNVAAETSKPNKRRPV